MLGVDGFDEITGGSPLIHNTSPRCDRLVVHYGNCFRSLAFFVEVRSVFAQICRANFKIVPLLSGCVG